MSGGVKVAITHFVKELLNIPDGETEEEIEEQETRRKRRRAQELEAEHRAQQARIEAKKVASKMNTEQRERGVDLDEMLDTILGRGRDSNGNTEEE